MQSMTLVAVGAAAVAAAGAAGGTPAEIEETPLKRQDCLSGMLLLLLLLLLLQETSCYRRGSYREHTAARAAASELTAANVDA